MFKIQVFNSISQPLKTKSRDRQTQLCSDWFPPAYPMERRLYIVLSGAEICLGKQQVLCSVDNSYYN